MHMLSKIKSKLNQIGNNQHWRKAIIHYPWKTEDN